MSGIEDIKLNSGLTMPRIGMGTWYLGENRNREAGEIEALQEGIRSGIRLIDTAEMYGDGGAERLVGKSIGGVPREELFLVSKVYPHNADERNLFNSLDDSLNRLGTDYLDLYLLHWRGAVPLVETVECMEACVRAGKIRGWGVSNFDISDMIDLINTPGGRSCAVNQVLYHLGSRGVEYSLMPWMQAHDIALMAYSPLAQKGRLRKGLMTSPEVRSIARDHGVSESQVLLAFDLQNGADIVVPRSGNPEHVRDNARAASLVLTDDEMKRLDRAFPAPHVKTPLDII